MTTTTTAPVWAFILANSRTIDSYAWTFVTNTALDREDFRGELIADLAATHHKYDSTRCGASTWIFMRARAVKRGMLRASYRNTGAGEVDPDRDTLGVGLRGNHDRIAAKAEVIGILDRATPAQRRAALSVLHGLDRGEVVARLGITAAQRDALVASLA